MIFLLIIQRAYDPQINDSALINVTRIDNIRSFKRHN
jgi:hypothetical protein